MHQTGPDATSDASPPLEHDGEAANDPLAVAEHTHDAKNKITIDVLAHKHQTGAAPVPDGPIPLVTQEQWTQTT